MKTDKIIDEWAHELAYDSSSATFDPKEWLTNFVYESGIIGPTLNRDKVMEILRNELYTRVEGQIDDETTVIIEGLEESANAVCSLSLPALSEGDKEKLFLTHCHATNLLGASVMDYDGFKAALKELTKPKEE